MNNYEGLFILDASVKEEDLKATIERIQKDIEQAGGRVDNVVQLGQRPLARTTVKWSSGFYVNVVFSAPTTVVTELNAKLKLDAAVYRWQFTRAIEETAKQKAKRLKKKEKAGARA